MEKWYECVKCKQMTKGMPATLRNKCLLCRVGELESRYRQRKYEKLPKKKLQAEHGRLNEKLKNFNDEDYETVSSFSEEDNDKDDPEFTPPPPPNTPGNECKEKIVENKTKYSKKRKLQISSNENEVVETIEPQETSNQEKNVKRKKTKEADKEQDDSSDYSDIESQCSFDKHLKFDKSYLPGHQFNYTFINKDLNENKKIL